MTQVFPEQKAWQETSVKDRRLLKERKRLSVPVIKGVSHGHLQTQWKVTTSLRETFPTIAMDSGSQSVS